jgi:hypothetical protein
VIQSNPDCSVATVEHFGTFDIPRGRLVERARMTHPTNLHSGPGRRVKVVMDPQWTGPWPAEPLGVIVPIMGEPYQTIDLRDN